MRPSPAGLIQAPKSLSWRVIARGAGHALADDKPDVVVQEVKRMIEYLRGGSAPAFGSTQTL